MVPAPYLMIHSRLRSTHLRSNSNSCAVNLPLPTTCTLGRTATEINSEGWTFGPREIFTRTSCEAPAFGEIQTTNGSPVRFGERLAISKRASPSGSETNSFKVLSASFFMLLPASVVHLSGLLVRKPPSTY